MNEQISLLQGRIDELERSAAVLRRAEMLSRSIINSMQMGIYIVQDGRIVFANQYTARYSGYSMDQLIGHEILDYIHPDDRDRVRENAVAMLKGEQTTPYEYRVTDSRGIVRWLMESVVPIEYQERRAVLGNIIDVTAFKEAQQKLRQMEELESSILASVPHALFGVENRQIFFANAAMEDVFGWKPEELIGKSTRIIFRNDEEWLEYGNNLYSTLEKQPVVIFETDTPFVRKDGSEFFCRMSVSRTGTELGRSRRIVATFEDITERRRAREALQESERRLADILEFMPDATLVIDRKGKVIAWNRAIEMMTGIRKEDILGKGDYEYAIPFYGERRPILIDLALRGEPELEKKYSPIQRMGDVVFGESFTPSLPGGNVHLSATASVLRDSKGEIIAAIECIRDSTERQKLEERLKRAEKMEGLGRLAGGVAHDLNNVLGVVVGYAELLSESVSEQSPLKIYADNILRSSIRGSAIIQDLLTLARRGVTVSETINLNSIVSDYLKTPEYEKLKSYHAGVKMRTELGADLLNINGSPVHLIKTLMNLVSNAAESITGEGEVIIKTENRYLDIPVRGYDDIKEGDYVVLTVKDTGSGISAKDLSMIFEPFYTNKVMGRSGTGLGLAVVWGTVKDLNGYIDVVSEEGKGSSFSIYFPATREGTVDSEQKLPRSEYAGKGELILVVDDIKEQRELAMSMLGRLNYRVEAVASGEEAVKYLEKGTPELVVLDMIMTPGMDGLDTYRKLLEIRPGQKAIIVSGYAETDRVKTAQQLGAGAFVRKPYIKERIGHAVRKELDRRS